MNNKKQCEEQATAASKKFPTKVVIIAAAAVLLVVLAVLLVFKSGKSADDYMAFGEYENAYNVAKNDKSKAAVTAENAVAVCCKDIVSQLENPQSFVLKEAYYDPSYLSTSQVVLTVSVELESGTQETLYCLYYYDTESSKYLLGPYYSDLAMEDPHGSDDAAEIAIWNTQKKMISDTMTSNNKLSDGSVTRINNLFANDLLDTISLLVNSQNTAN